MKINDKGKREITGGDMVAGALTLAAAVVSLASLPASGIACGVLGAAGFLAGAYKGYNKENENPKTTALKSAVTGGLLAATATALWLPAIVAGVWSYANKDVLWDKESESPSSDNKGAAATTPDQPGFLDQMKQKLLPNAPGGTSKTSAEPARTAPSSPAPVIR